MGLIGVYIERVGLMGVFHIECGFNRCFSYREGGFSRSLGSNLRVGGKNRCCSYREGGFNTAYSIWHK
jgi:hypothetical protein